MKSLLRLFLTPIKIKLIKKYATETVKNTQGFVLPVQFGHGQDTR